jgi:nickel/cobalt exporter
MNFLLTLPAAIGLGALHALEPGHGKGVISAYLVATRGKMKSAVLLGVVSAITHTFSVIVLAFTASTAIKLLAPGILIGWIEMISGIMIMLIGASILHRHFRPSITSLGKLSQIHHDQRDAHHDHDHGHHHWHPKHEEPSSLFGVISVGLLTGLIPCPSAIAIFLASLNADHLTVGIGLVAAFSLGSAISMSAIGILVVRSSAVIKRLDRIGFVRSLNMVSSILILGLGVMVTWHSLQQF